MKRTILRLKSVKTTVHGENTDNNHPKHFPLVRYDMAYLRLPIDAKCS